MKNLRLCLLAQFFCIAWFPTLGTAADVIIDHSEALQQLEFVNQSGSNARPVAGSSRVSAMRFNALGKNYVLNLSENSMVMGAVRRVSSAANIVAYRGDIYGQADSWARITVVDGVPTGMLWDGSDMYAIDVVNGEASIFLLSSLRVTDGAMLCSAAQATTNAGELFDVVAQEVSDTVIRREAQGAVSQLDIAAIGDFEFATDRGPDAQADIITRMNNVDGIFSAQLGVQINVNQIDVFADANDPFSDASEAGDLLDELGNFRFDTPSQNANGLTHLFTGRELDGSTVGIAFSFTNSGSLCSQQFGAGLTQATHTAIFDSLIAAHELGHNFGAPHDGEDDSACVDEPLDFLMAPRLNGSDTFSSCSIMQMQDDVNRAQCISALPGADVSVVASDPTSNALLANSATVVFNVSSNGTDDIGNVAATISIPTNVEFESVTASVGNCANGAGTISCTIGTLTAGSSVTITTTARTTAVGAADFVVSVTADGDANAINNQATARVTVMPAVDLLVAAAGTTQVGLNASTNLQLGAENRATIPATDVTVLVTLDTGIRVDTATWDAGSCSVENGNVTCTTASLAANANSVISLGVTGVSSGAIDYMLSIDATEVDREVTNNSTSGQITVNAVVQDPGATDSGGGGGSLSWMLLSLLTFVRLVVAVTRAPTQHLLVQPT